MMNETTLDEEARLKTLVKDYFGEFVTARKTIEELDRTLSDNKFFTKDGGLVLEGVNLSANCSHTAGERDRGAHRRAHCSSAAKP